MTPPEHGAFIDGVVRQSTLKTYDQCPLRAVHEARAEFTDYSSGPASLGTAFHMVAEAILQTLHQQGERQIPTQEAIEIMREVVAGEDAPHLSLEQQRDLRFMVLRFAGETWASHRIMSLEGRLFATVPCPDGVERTITGQPDALFADPPDGAVVVDYKTGWAVPPSPRDEDEPLRDGGRPYLSERGHFQLDTLGLLVMRNFEAVDRVILREHYPRLGEHREATLGRGELEHVEKDLGLLAFRLERDLESAEPAEPRPGKWCSHCPMLRDCPVPEGDRELGVLGPDTADGEAQRFAVIATLNKQMRKGLKAYHEETGHAPTLADGRSLRWKTKPDGGRSFDFHTPDEAVPDGV